MKPETLPSRDRTYRWANHLVGFNVPRWWIRKLSPAKYEKAIKYITYMWLTANDNIVKRVNRPQWFPKKYIWGRKL